MEDGAAGDVVEDGGGALIVTGTAGGAGEKETWGAAGAGTLYAAASDRPQASRRTRHRARDPGRPWVRADRYGFCPETVLI